MGNQIEEKDRIEKTVELNAPVDRVWRAVTDSKEFGEWFRVDLEGPFAVGEKVEGQVTYPGHEHMRFEATVEAIEPKRRFAFRWCPYGGEPEVDASEEPTTLVEFRLEPTASGTRLFIVESGFNAIPEERREEAWRRNKGGWDAQAENITAYVDS